MQNIVTYGQGFLESVVQFAGDRPVRVSGGDRPLVYLQIPQAARQGFTYYLKEHFRDLVFSVPPLPLELTGTDGKYRCRKLYRGHFHFAQWQHPASDAWLLCFLRDPVQRVVAQYHAHHHPTVAQLIGAGTSGEARRLLKFAQRASLEEYVRSDDPFLLSHLHDVQTRSLTSFASPDHPRFLTSALENLEQQFLFFGLAEFHETSLHLFRAQLGSSRPTVRTPTGGTIIR